MTKQIKACVVKTITGGYSVCKCHNQPPFALISDDENVCKEICCEIMSSYYYKFNDGEKKLCPDSCLNFDTKAEFKANRKKLYYNFNPGIGGDSSWFI